MKRIIPLLICLFLLFGLVACTVKEPIETPDEEPLPTEEIAYEGKTATVRGVIYGLEENGDALVVGVTGLAQGETSLLLQKEPARGYRLTAIRAASLSACQSLQKLYYTGSAEEWESISVPSDLPTVFCYATTQPKTEGRYWHYDDKDHVVEWHYHHFDLRVENERYLVSAVACGETGSYYFSCTCGEHGDTTFLGEPQKHRFGVVVSDGGVIEKVYCTNEGCGSMEKLNFALPTAGKLVGCYDCTQGDDDNDYSMIDSAKVFYYEDCTVENYNAYVEKLKNDGCVEKATYKMGNNLYTLLSHEKFTTYVSYLSGEGALRVYVGRSDDLNPSKAAVKDEGLCKPALWQIDVDCQAAKANGGMSYVMQLTDGKFLVVDGGYRTNEDATNIYEILIANKPKNHEKPIIAGWFITHMHIDHMGVLRNFANLYQNAVTVEAFYYNIPYSNIGDLWPNNSRIMENEIRDAWGASLYRKVHSGMSFSFSGAKVTILCTFEDVYPLNFTSGNDTSTVFKVEMGGQSILFLGDAEHGESDRMMYLDDEVVHADIMQYAHHGYDNQCRNEFYQKVNPSVVLWPMTFINWENRGTPYGEVFRWRYEERKENAWARSAWNVKKIIVMAEGTTKLELPYTPTGARNANYKKLYEEQVAKIKN